MSDQEEQEPLGALKKRGRPPLDPNEASLTFGLRLTPAQYADLCRKAVRDGISIAEVIRRGQF